MNKQPHQFNVSDIDPDFKHTSNYVKRHYGKDHVYAIVKFKTGYYQNHTTTEIYNRNSDYFFDTKYESNWINEAIKQAKDAGDTGEVYGVYIANQLRTINLAIKNEIYDGVAPFRFYIKRERNRFISTLRKGK